MIFDKYKNSYKTAKNVMKIKMNIYNDDNIYTKHVYKRKKQIRETFFFIFYIFYYEKSNYTRQLR